MVNAGIDSIKIHKTFTPEESALIEKHIVRDREKNNWFHDFLIFRDRKIKHKYSFERSFARFVSKEDNNLILADPDDIREAIEKFKQITQLDIGDALVSRLDVSMTFNTDRPVEEYLDLMAKQNHYKIHEEDYGRYLNGSEKTLVLYDKAKEMTRSGNAPEDFDRTQNLVRIEMRIKRHVKSKLHLRDGDLTLSALAEYGFPSALRLLKDDSIRLLKLQPPEVQTPPAIITMDDVRMEAQKILALKYPDEYQNIIEQVRSNAGVEVEDTLKTLREELYTKITSLCNETIEKFPASEVTASEEAIHASSVMRKRNIRRKKKEIERIEKDLKKVKL